MIGALPFLITYSLYENLKSSPSASPIYLTSYASRIANNTPTSILLEGIYGQLFSVGRSIFLYSPLLLVVIFFWHKIRKIILPEVLAFITLSLTYLVFYATQYSFTPELGYSPLWHGESSWGPRYLLPLLPLGLIIVGFIYTKLSKIAKLFVFYPLAIIGILINLLGILMPYQIKFHELQRDFFVNGNEYTSFTYSNLLPRYSPVFMMSKKLVKLVQEFPKTLDHGVYNVRFFDGVDFTFNVGPERWRSIEEKGYISFDNKTDSYVEKFSIDLINHPLKDSSSSASINLRLNNTLLLTESLLLESTERVTIDIPVEKSIIKEENNELIIEVQYDKVNMEKEQLLGLISFSINNQQINLESLDFPYVSSLGPTIVKAKYQNYGGTNQDPWKLWHIHTQIYERSLDFWWVKPLFYWDLPKSLFSKLLVLNLVGLIYFGYKTATKPPSNSNHNLS